MTHFFLKVTQTTLTHTHCMFWGTELDVSCRLCVTVRQIDSYMDVHVSRPRVFLLGRGSITGRVCQLVLWNCTETDCTGMYYEETERNTTCIALQVCKIYIV